MTPALDPNDPIRVGLLWHSMNSDNLGVGALTLGHMSVVQSAAEAAGRSVAFTVLGWADPRRPYFEAENVAVHGLRLRDFARPNGGFLDAVGRQDVILDIWRRRQFLGHLRPGADRQNDRCAESRSVVGRAVNHQSTNVGPFENPVIRASALSVMRRARCVAVRDQLSAECARAMGYAGDLILASDVALRMEAPSRESEGPRDGARTRVGVNVSGLLFNGGYTGKNMFGLKADYQDAMRDVVKALSAERDVEIHFIGHVISETNPVEDDHRAAQRLAEGFPDAVVAPAFRHAARREGLYCEHGFLRRRANARLHRRFLIRRSRRAARLQPQIRGLIRLSRLSEHA